jgi:hypothetical protein
VSLFPACPTPRRTHFKQRGAGIGSSLFSVGEDEIQRNNQEIRKSGKERDECGLSTTESIAVAHP